MKVLPATGTAAFLEILSPRIPDDLIDSLFAHRSVRGRPQIFSPSQLFRVTLLPLLTPARSYNLIARLLGEQRSLRSFARLRNRTAVPDVRMLHEFRSRTDLAQLRRLNAHLLRPLLDGAGKFAKTVALIDWTDLPAATNGYKKIPPANYFSRRANLVRAAQRWSESLLRRLQETHLAAWLRQHSSSILLAPLVSWAAPANRDDCIFLEPGIHYCAQQLEWTPDILLGDMSYVGLHRQRRLRENKHVALITKLTPDMNLPEEFEDIFTMTCEQG